MTRIAEATDHTFVESQKQPDGRYLYRPRFAHERDSDEWRPFEEVAADRNKRHACDPERKGGARITVDDAYDGARRHFGETVRIAMSTSSSEYEDLKDDPDWYHIGSVSVRASQPDMPAFIPTPPFMRDDA